MPRNVIANLAVGTRFLRMALGCMQSAQAVCGDRYTYVIFYAWCDCDSFDVPAYVHLINIENIISSRKTRDLYTDDYRAVTLDTIQSDKFAAREIKGIPFIYPDFVDDNMVFLDADVIVFEDCFEQLFAKAVASSIVTLGGAMPDDIASYDWPKANWTFNLRTEARKAGFDVQNRRVHTGVVGRAGDNVAKFVSTTFDGLLQTKPFPLFPENVKYFNDEAYFALALSIAAVRWPQKNFHTIGSLDFMKTTLGKTFLGVDPVSHKPVLGKPDAPEMRDTSYSILHFHTITTWDADYYSSWLDENVPPLLRRGSAAKST